MLFLSVRGFFDYAGPINPLAINVVVVLPSSLPERSRHPDPSVFRSSIARPTDTSVYASSATSRCHLQDSRPGWSRCLLSCRALSSPTTCRFTPAHSGWPTIRPELNAGTSNARYGGLWQRRFLSPFTIATRIKPSRTIKRRTPCSWKESSSSRRNDWRRADQP